MHHSEKSKKEINGINRLIESGFQIFSVEETLSGSLVKFVRKNRCETLLILTPEGRKYFPLKMKA